MRISYTVIRRGELRSPLGAHSAPLRMATALRSARFVRSPLIQNHTGQHFRKGVHCVYGLLEGVALVAHFNQQRFWHKVGAEAKGAKVYAARKIIIHLIRGELRLKAEREVVRQVRIRQRGNGRGHTIYITQGKPV